MYKYAKDIWRLTMREVRIMSGNPIYVFCMVAFPLLVLAFFTSMLTDGQPKDMPIGVVDLDNTSTTRSLVRRLDAFQNTRVAARYASMGEARRAIQNNEIYGFLLLPKGTTDKLLASRQPKVSFYYTMSSITAGSMVYKDLKTFEVKARPIEKLEGLRPGMSLIIK